MSTVTLTTSPLSDAVVGVARAQVDDPTNTFTGIVFDVVLVDASGNEVQRTSSLPPDRVVDAGVFEKDAVLDASLQTHIEAYGVVPGNRVVSTPAFVNFGPSQPNASALACELASAVAGIEYWRLDVGIAPGSAAAWRCWIRANAWPTTNGDPNGTPDDQYMRMEGRRDDLGFSMQLAQVGTPDLWYVIVAGYTAITSGVMGQRFTDTIAFTTGVGVRPTLQISTIHNDAVAQRTADVLSSLNEFTDWLSRYRQRGYLGEFGWTWNESSAWNQIGDAVLTQADATKLWASDWAVGELWGPNYTLQPFLLQSGAWVNEPQEAILEAHLSTADYLRGLNFAGAEFGTPTTEPTSSFSNENPGTYGADYLWNGLGSGSPNVYQYAQSRGHVLARIPFRWERLQPVLGAALDAGELSRMHASVDAAIAAGLSVILDVHNYGGYYLFDGTQGVRYTIGTPQVTFDQFADLWSRIATEFNGVAGVIGYGLMNEPVDMAAVGGSTPAHMWEQAAQTAASAIRAVALQPGQSAKWILVGGYEWSGTWSLAAHHNGPFVNDSANLVMYEGHLYFDADRSGSYATLEFTPPTEQNWVQWTPSSVTWQWQSAAGEDIGEYEVELYRVGVPARLTEVPIWTKGAADPHIVRCTLPDAGCAFQSFEYRVVMVNTIDGTTIEYGAELSGAFTE